MRLNFEIFKFRKNKSNTTEVMTPVSGSKTKTLHIVLLFIFLGLISGIGAYIYFSGHGHKGRDDIEVFKKQLGSADLSSNMVSQHQEHALPDNTSGSPQTSQQASNQSPTNQTNQNLSEKNSPQPIVKSQSTENKARANANPVETTSTSNSTNSSIFQRQVYMPAKDILVNELDLKQQKEKIELLKAQVELKKLEAELAKINSEISLIPITAQVSKIDLTKKVKEDNVIPVPVKQEIEPLPTIISISNNTALIQTIMGEHIRVKEGDTVGDYTVKSIGSNNVELVDKKNKRVNIIMRLPEQYPIPQGMFVKSDGNVPQSPSTTTQPQQLTRGQGNFPTNPQLVPIMGIK